MVETSVIVLTWNQKDLTIRCLHSLLKQTYKNYEVILVDNGSEDGTAECVKKEFGTKVKVVSLKKNKGFAGGNNEGVRNTSKESKYVMCLNNDTIVKPNLLREAINSIESNENIGAVYVPVIDKGYEQLFKENWESGISSTLNIFADSVIVHFKKPIKNNHFVFVPWGTCFIYKKEIINLPFDDYYFIYSEDNYLGLLLRILGHEVVVCRKSIIFHENSSVKYNSSAAFKRHLKFLGRRNKILNQLLFFETKTLIKITPLLIIYHLFENLYDIKNIRVRINVYFNIFKNFKFIIKKRKEIKSLRRLNDNDYLKLFSYKFLREDMFKNNILTFFVKLLNNISRVYCFILRIKTMEFSKEVQKKYKIIKV